MTKARAAELLGVSERTLERYAKAGRISHAYVKGPKGDEADFQEQDVERLKQELAKRPTAPPTLDIDSHDTAEETATTTALARIDSRSDGSLVAARQARRDRHDIDVSLLSLKRLYTLEEAELLTGISKERLRKAIAAGELVAGKDGRGWKVLPAQLDAFLLKRFGSLTDTNDSHDTTPSTD